MLDRIDKAFDDLFEGIHGKKDFIATRNRLVTEIAMSDITLEKKKEYEFYLEQIYEISLCRIRDQEKNQDNGKNQGQNQGQGKEHGEEHNKGQVNSHYREYCFDNTDDGDWIK